MSSTTVVMRSLPLYKLLGGKGCIVKIIIRSRAFFTHLEEEEEAMVLAASELVLPCTEYDQVAYEYGINNTAKKPGNGRLEKTESLQRQTEKQISVDPVSLSLVTPQHHHDQEKAAAPPSPGLILKHHHQHQHHHHHQHQHEHPPKMKATAASPTLLHLKSKFLSSSLPCSATSSPRFGPDLLKKKAKHHNQPSTNSIMITNNPMAALARHHSVVLSQLAHHHQDSHLPRSKSCGEGRASAPPDDFDLWLTKSNSIRQQSRPCSTTSSFSKIEAKLDGTAHTEIGARVDPMDEKFKCGALCLFLPGFGKGKPVRPRKQEAEEEEEEGGGGGRRRRAEIIENNNNNIVVVSRTVSLEKFECGSWTSSAIVQEEDEEDGASNLFFDLPLELIRSNANDADSPVRAAFVFDKDLKGVLKNGGTSSKSHSQESSRHVRFSTSSQMSQHPTSPSSCITPRLRKARDDFNAFLEAQTA